MSLQGIMEKKMEATVVCWGYTGDNGKEHGSYCGILGMYRDNVTYFWGPGKVYSRVYWGYIRDNGKEHGSYYLGFSFLGYVINPREIFTPEALSQGRRSGYEAALPGLKVCKIHTFRVIIMGVGLLFYTFFLGFGNSSCASP